MKRLAITSLLCVSFFACGDGPNDDDAGTHDAGTTSDAGSSDGGTSTAGAISFFGGMDGGLESSTFQVVADFVEGSGSGNSDYSCTTPVGGCVYCPAIPRDGGVSGVSVRFLSAGTLTVLDNATTMATLPYDGDAGIYAADQETNPALVWSTGDTLVVSASGGDVPAFTASTIGLEPLANVSPALSPVSPITMSLSGGFTIRWALDSDTYAFVELVLGEDNSGGATISCNAPETLASIFVDPSVLAHFAGATTGEITLRKTYGRLIDAGTVPLTLTVETPQVYGTVSYTP